MENNEIITGERWTKAVYIFESGVTIEFPNYMVSDYGRVKSLNYNHTGKERIMKPRANKMKDETIVYMICLRKDNKKYFQNVHRLVLSSFKRNDYFLGAIVDHIHRRTGSDCDNTLENLRWVTPSQNVSTEYCRESLSKKLTNRKDQSKRVRVTFSDGTIKEYPSAKEAGRALGISPYTPTGCINGRKGYYKKLDIRFEYID